MERGMKDKKWSGVRNRIVTNCELVFSSQQNDNMFLMLKGIKKNWLLVSDRLCISTQATIQRRSMTIYSEKSSNLLFQHPLSYLPPFTSFFSSEKVKMTSHHCVRQAMIIKGFVSQEEFLLSSPHKTFAQICTECVHMTENLVIH